MTTSIIGGYYCLSVTQLCNLLFAMTKGIITYRDLRTYFAIASMQASREVAKRTGSKVAPQFIVEEVYKLVGGVGEKVAKKSIRALENAGLLEFSSSKITLNKEPIPGSEELLEKATGRGRSPRRLIPVPRRVLRYLARCTKPSVAKTIIAYLIRGLSRRRDGTINNKGSVKSSWIARIAGISLRAAKAARRLLTILGLITVDSNAHQCRLNRTGVYFEINTAWEEQESNSEFSPLPHQSEGKLSPPIKDIKTLSDLKNQKTLSGASKSRYREPTLNNIQPGDLKRMSSVLVLYNQAVEKGWLNGSEADRLFFIATAIRVHRTNCNDPVRVFVAIIRRNLRSYITQAQEDSARRQFQNHINRQLGKGVAYFESQSPNTNLSKGKEGGFVQSLVSKVVQKVSPLARRQLVA